jgi:hypothetical protein
VQQVEALDGGAIAAAPLLCRLLHQGRAAHSVVRKRQGPRRGVQACRGK